MRYMHMRYMQMRVPTEGADPLPADPRPADPLPADPRVFVTAVIDYWVRTYDIVGHNQAVARERGLQFAATLSLASAVLHQEHALVIVRLHRAAAPPVDIVREQLEVWLAMRPAYRDFGETGHLEYPD